MSSPYPTRPPIRLRKPAVPQRLYHYTCRDHGFPGIAHARVLRPHLHPILRRPLVWLTDLNPPDAWTLGLTQETLCCSRTEAEARVLPHEHEDACGITPWWYYARPMSRTLRDILEDIGSPMHWYVTEKPVPVASVHLRVAA